MTPARTILFMGEHHHPITSPAPSCTLAPFTVARRPEDLSPLSIFDSIFGTPARYVRELFRRPSLLNPHGALHDRVIINPLLEPSVDLFTPLLPRLATIHRHTSPLVISDRTNMPAAYLLPATIPPEEGKFLSLLSTTNALLDRDLLDTLHGRCDIVTIDADLRTLRGNGFNQTSDLDAIWEWTASSALSLLGRHLFRSPSLRTPTGRRHLRSSIPLVGFLPYHAGDVLFYALASRTGEKDLAGIAVSSRFTDILDEIVPGYEQTPLSVPPTRHKPGDPSDEEYFFTTIDQLSPFRFHYYCRPSRGRTTTSFNLIDHFAFAQGSPMTRAEDLASRRLPPPRRHPTPPSPPIRVLLHFDAGWPLKVYPRHSQKRLIRALLDRGFDITVLGSEEKNHGGYCSVPFTTLAALRELIASHHLIVGSDSFPSHYASYVMGVPTIYLFGPTGQEIAAPPCSAITLAEERRLDCRPCNNIDLCPVNRRGWCDNFIPPEQLLSDILDMLDRTVLTTPKEDQSA